MIKTMNWGKGIVIGLAAFVVFIIGLCVYMVASPTDDIDHQYYEKGLNFDHDYEREQQVVKDNAQPLIQFSNDQLKLIFSQSAKGTVKFMRPSSTLSDKVYPVNNTELDIPLKSLARGEWQLTFEWKSNKKAYLFNHEVYIK
jgi:hypothetical protein